MISRSLIEQTKCRWREFKREPSAFFWVIFMPLIWMIGLGFAFSHPRPEKYGIGWQSPTTPAPFAQKVEERLKADPQINFKTGTPDDLVRMFQRGEVSVIVDVASSQTSYRFDQANPEAVRAQKHVDALVQETAGRVNPVATAQEPLKAQGGRYVDFLIPGLLGLSIMSSSLFGVGMTLVANRRDNLLKRYLVTPMRPWEYMTSQILGRLIVLTVEFSAIALAGFLIFRFHVYGSFGSYIALAFLGAAAFTAIALLCASRTRSLPTVSGLMNMIMIPSMMLSGVFFSKNNLPDWLQAGVNLLPLTALNDALRKVALEGLPLVACGHEMAVLGVYLVVGTLLSMKLFRWY